MTEIKTDARETSFSDDVVRINRVPLFKSINFLVAFTMYSFGHSLGMPR